MWWSLYIIIVNLMVKINNLKCKIFSNKYCLKILLFRDMFILIFNYIVIMCYVFEYNVRKNG